MAYQDITGVKFGYLTVMKEVEPFINSKGKQERMWLCKCDCGNTKIVKRSCLKWGTNSSCGCKTIAKEINPGDRFGKLFVVMQGQNMREKTGHMRRTYICQCDCGNIISVYGKDLLAGRKKCKRCKIPEKIKRNTIKNKRIYNIWNCMINRCYNTNSSNYKYYGGKGISVCENWKCEGGYNNFLQWSLLNGYKDDLSIDRIDVLKNYTPDNCRWVDIKTQSRNKTNTIYVNYNGHRKCLAELAEENNIDYNLLSGRLKRGWDIEKALTTPRRMKKSSLSKT